MKIILTDSQKQSLEDMHGKSRDKRVCDRIKAVLLASEGWTQRMIAQALRIHESSVKRHLDDYIELNKLKPENGGSESHLSEAQTLELIQYLTDVTYHHTHQIIAHVEAVYGIKYTVPGMNKWLHRNGFSYKKRKGVPHQFNEHEQDAFIKEYEALKANKAPDDVILFMDAVHPTQATKITSGWIRKGVDKVIETTGSRTRLNIIGALNLSDISNTIVSYNDTINKESIARFLMGLREHYPLEQRIHLILDGAAYHRANLVKDVAWIYNIQLHYLPPYSPNLNPIERLWKVMNEQARNDVYFATKRDFVSAIKNFFSNTLPQIAGSLVTRLTDNFQRLIPAS